MDAINKINGADDGAVRCSKYNILVLIKDSTLFYQVTSIVKKSTNELIILEEIAKQSAILSLTIKTKLRFANHFANMRF